MKKLKFILIMLIFFNFYGCIDIKQSISINNNNIYLYLKFVVHKLLVEMINVFSDEEIDYDNSELSKNNILKIFPKELEPKYEKIDNNFEYGFSLILKIPYKYLKVRDSDVYFVPFFEKNKIIIYLPEFSNEDKEENVSNFEIAFLSSSKYTLILSRNFIKKYLKNINFVKLISKTKSIDIEFTELPEMYFIEIPLVYLFMTNEKLKLILY